MWEIKNDSLEACLSNFVKDILNPLFFYSINIFQADVKL